MSAVTGALVGLGFGAGLVTTLLSLVRSRRPALQDRVAPYVLDLPSAPRMLTERAPSLAPTALGWAVFGPSLRRLAGVVERVLGGGSSVRRRMLRLGSPTSVEQFRLQQVQWASSPWRRLRASVSSSPWPVRWLRCRWSSPQWPLSWPASWGATSG